MLRTEDAAAAAAAEAEVGEVSAVVASAVMNLKKVICLHNCILVDVRKKVVSLLGPFLLQRRQGGRRGRGRGIVRRRRRRAAAAARGVRCSIQDDDQVRQGGGAVVSCEREKHM